ncbi:uncharacterized protein LOC124282289 [Haliotis rubra]|uniref:uncharacterized protein LOC124282289 n=1 Tax=Haliotis rubra TaxID=36100 RepID=UPI001EE5A9BD|nr:uncharacterized protein LOC124282289 [Haliotis rubra]
MADKLLERHLTCSICMGVFTDPATLQCQHTFCRSCLLQYIHTQPETLHVRCPTCRHQSEVGVPSRRVSDWVRQLKPSFVIQGLLDDFGPATLDTISRRIIVGLDNGPTPARVVYEHGLLNSARSLEELQLEAKVNDVHDRKSSALHHIIDYRWKSKESPDLKDVTVLTVDNMKVTVVMDLNNKSATAVFISKHKQFQQHLRFQNRPWQIAKISDRRIAVSVPQSNGIVFIHFNPNLEVESCIMTCKQYYALACLTPSQLVVGTVGGQYSVDIIDMSGNVLRSIHTGRIYSPDCIHVTSDRNLVVSQGKVRSLVSVTDEGEMIFEYTPTGTRILQWPQGVKTSSNGDILLVDGGSHKVVQLTEKGQYVRDLLIDDALDDPRGLWLDGDLLYVTLQDCVKVFSLKHYLIFGKKKG